MIKRSKGSGSSMKVTFVVPMADCDQALSVVGEFNDWDPLATPLRKRSNRTRSASVELPIGGSYRFKYLAEGGDWFCDPDADSHVANDYASVDSLLVV
jgi:1,4-alpha-glucan branching enzyme